MRGGEEGEESGKGEIGEGEGVRWGRDEGGGDGGEEVGEG